MRIKVLTSQLAIALLLAIGLYSGAIGTAYGQSPRTNPAIPVSDLPTQRRLEIPDGDLPDIAEQARLLQQLRDLVSPKDSPDAVPLSAQQLEQMERIFKRWQADAGSDFELPNLDSIPQEWIDQAIANPQIRKQAEQILERYAQERQPLPSTSSNASGFRSPDNSPTERRSSSSNSSSNPFPANANGSAANSNASPDRNLSPQPLNDPKKVKALQDLIKQLTDAQQKQTSSTATNNRGAQDASQPRSAQPRGAQSTASGAKREMNSGNAATTPLGADAMAERVKAMEALRNAARARAEQQARADKARADALAGSSNGTSSINGAGGLKGQPGGDASSNSLPNYDSPFDPNANELSSGNNLTNPASPSSFPELDSDGSQNPFENSSNTANGNQRSNTSSSGLNRSSNANPLPTLSSLRDAWQSQSGGASRNKSATANPRSQGSANQLPAGRNPTATNPTAANPRLGNSDSNGNKVASELDVKSAIERHGLGETLRRIVEKTVSEQTQERGNSKRSAESSPKTSSSAATTSQAPNWKLNQANSPTQVQPSVNSVKTNPMQQTARTSGTEESRAGSSAFREFVTDVWRSVSTVTPAESSGEQSPGRASDLSNSPLGVPNFSGASGWLPVAALLAAVVMLVWLLGRRGQRFDATASDAAETAWAQELLRVGLKSREDVVRAFHHFVLRRPHPVANWWHHRLVANRITESSPHLRAAILEFSSLYELARYQPPDVELSSEQLLRAQSVLKQCEA